ncbi:MAG: ATPase domain-containing protein, partial [Nanoarchaeota archaeon]
MNKENVELQQLDKFEKDLISFLNKENNERIAYNLSNDIVPININRWLSTGSKYLDYAISNKKDGGIPEGRITEIFGSPAIGKSHIALQIAKSAQSMGGMCIYIDTENATSIENLKVLGVNVKNRFVFVETSCTEEVFKAIESTILRTKEISKNVPVVIIWDSVAASSPKAELLADYDKDSIGLQARAMSKGLRKITKLIADSSVTLCCLNQTRTKIGEYYGDNVVTPGGQALPFHSSVRIHLMGGSKIKNDNGEIIALKVIAKILKNKVAFPHRKAEFEIHFGKGIYEHEQIFDLLKNYDKPIDQSKSFSIKASEGGAWKTIEVINSTTGEVILEKKFRKNEYIEAMSDPILKEYIDNFLEDVLVKKI